MNQYTITTITLAAAEQLETNKLQAFDIQASLAETFIVNGVKDGQVTKACKAVDQRLDLTMKGSSFAARMVEAVKVVKAAGGTQVAVSDALMAFNVERLDANRNAVGSLQNVDFQAYLGITKVAKKAAKKVSKTIDLSVLEGDVKALVAAQLEIADMLARCSAAAA